MICDFNGTDVMDVGKGDDTLSGSPGADPSGDDEGQDRLNAQDGRGRDRLDGGVGSDLFRKDREDTARNCE